MTTMAQAIETFARDANEAMEMATERAVAADQDWANESTSYVFDDNSVLIVIGQSFYERKTPGQAKRDAA